MTNVLKRLVKAISIMSVLNIAVLLGLGRYAWSQGWLTRDRILGAAAVLRGDGEGMDDGASDAMAADEAPKLASEQIEHNVALQERSRIELVRREAEVQQNWRFLEGQQLRFLREKEAFAEKLKRAEEEEDRQAVEADNSGMQKELELLAGIKAKEAKALLRQKDDAEVVRILKSMESRKARKIVSACKTDEERLWIGRILGKLHERDATQAEALGAGS